MSATITSSSLQSTATGARHLAGDSDGFYASQTTEYLHFFRLSVNPDGGGIRGSEENETNNGFDRDDASQIQSRSLDGIYPKTVYSYIYSNPTWQDQLTQIKTYTVNQTTGIQTLTDTQSISYDAMGNPTSYLGKTMEWEEKQLSEVIAGNNTISYTYDENGLRTQKTANGTTTNYHYNGSMLIGLTNSGNRSDSFRFSYDSNGNVVSISWDMPRTHNPSGTAYYLRNAQGDIISMGETLLSKYA